MPPPQAPILLGDDESNIGVSSTSTFGGLETDYWLAIGAVAVALLTLCAAAYVVHRRLKLHARKDSSSGTRGRGRSLEELSANASGPILSAPAAAPPGSKKDRMNLGKMGSSIGLALVSGVDEKQDKDEFFGASQMRPSGGMQLHREASRGTGLLSADSRQQSSADRSSRGRPVGTGLRSEFL